MKRTIEFRTAVGSVAKVVLRRAVTLPQVTAAQTTIVIVREGTLEVARNGRSRRACEHQVIVLPAGMAFDIAYVMSEQSRFVANWLIPCFPNDDRHASASEMAEPDWLPGPMDGAKPSFRQSLERAIAAITTEELPDSIARHQMQEVSQWIAVNGGFVCDSPISSEVSRIWRILATDPMQEWSPFDIAERIGIPVTRLRSLVTRDGTSLARLLHDLRMGHALALLLATDLPIHGVAAETGYRCVNQFRTRFRERYGLLPGDVRGHDRPIRSRHYSRLPTTGAALLQRSEPLTAASVARS